MKEVRDSERVVATTDTDCEIDSKFLHDLIQPLTAIENYASAGLLMSGKSEVPLAEIKQIFERIREEVQRANMLCRKLPS